MNLFSAPGSQISIELEVALDFKRFLLCLQRKIFLTTTPHCPTTMALSIIGQPLLTLKNLFLTRPSHLPEKKSQPSFYSTHISSSSALICQEELLVH